MKLFQRRPSLAPELLKTVFGLNLPTLKDDEVTLGSETFTTSPEFTSRVADRTILLGKSSAPDCALIIESQLRKDADKRFRWPLYIAHARDLWECPAVLLVMTQNDEVARWCGEPIHLGHPRLVLRPLVLSGINTPRITDSGEASQDPELTVLSAIAHGRRPGYEEVLKVVPAALSATKQSTTRMYYDFVRDSLPEVAKRYLEEIMAVGSNYDYKTTWLRESKAEGEADQLLIVLEARGLAVSDEARERINGCTDLDQLREWGRRSVTVRTVDELFL